MSTKSERPRASRQSCNPKLVGPSEAEAEIYTQHAKALETVTALAALHGARPSDLASARAWPLLWLVEIFCRHELEPYAEIGRRVVGGRRHNSQDQAKVRAAWEPVVKTAWEFARADQPRRGLARKIRQKLGHGAMSTRQINRILDKLRALPDPDK
jgi:hypothetical protein